MQTKLSRHAGKHSAAASDVAVSDRDTRTRVEKKRIVPGWYRETSRSSTRIAHPTAERGARRRRCLGGRPLLAAAGAPILGPLLRGGVAFGAWAAGEPDPTRRHPLAVARLHRAPAKRRFIAQPSVEPSSQAFVKSASASAERWR